MWEFTQGPKVSTQVHGEPREDTFSMIGLPRVMGGSEVPRQSQTQGAAGGQGMEGLTKDDSDKDT